MLGIILGFLKATLYGLLQKWTWTKVFSWKTKFLPIVGKKYLSSQWAQPLLNYDECFFCCQRKYARGLRQFCLGFGGREMRRVNGLNGAQRRN